MRRGVILLFLISLQLVPIFGCYQDEEGGEVSRQEASRIVAAVLYEVDTASGQAYTPGTAVRVVHNGIINFTNNDGSIAVTGNYIYDDAIFSYDYTMTIGFTNYTGSNGIQIDGLTTFDASMASLTNYSFSYNGSFSVVYQGVPYILSWDMSLTYMNEGYTYTGFYDVDGTRFDYSYSSGGIASR